MTNSSRRASPQPWPSRAGLLEMPTSLMGVSIAMPSSGPFFLFHEELLEVLVTEGTAGLRVLAQFRVRVTDWEVARSADIS